MYNIYNEWMMLPLTLLQYGQRLTFLHAVFKAFKIARFLISSNPGLFNLVKYFLLSFSSSKTLPQV